jgi:hypothetical protein
MHDHFQPIFGQISGKSPFLLIDEKEHKGHLYPDPLPIPYPTNANHLSILARLLLESASDLYLRYEEQIVNQFSLAYKNQIKQFEHCQDPYARLEMTQKRTRTGQMDNGSPFFLT